MMNSFYIDVKRFYEQTVLTYIDSLYQNPFRFIMLILDIAIVVFLFSKMIKIVKDSRAWQLLKGIVFLIIATALSSLLGLNILNYILTSVMTYGVLAIIVIFQPELRRALEQLGTNRITKFFGIDKDILAKTKEDIYKISQDTQRGRVCGLQRRHKGCTPCPHHHWSARRLWSWPHHWRLSPCGSLWYCQSYK